MLESPNWGLASRYWFDYSHWSLIHPYFKFQLSILNLKVQRKSMSFKSSFGALEDAGGSWLGFVILILIWIRSGFLLGSSLKFSSVQKKLIIGSVNFSWYFPGPCGCGVGAVRVRVLRILLSLSSGLDWALTNVSSDSKLIEFSNYLPD